MLIDLLRHGETVNGHVYCGSTDSELTTQGWHQMQDACCVAQSWQRIVSSPLKRCAEFASHLATQLNLPLRFDQRWREMDFGLWEGLSAKDIMLSDSQLLTKFWSNPLQNSPPEGESLYAVKQRVIESWEEIINDISDTLIISHGGPMRIIHCHIYNIPVQELLKIEIKHAQLNRISLTQLSSVVEL